MIAQPLHKEAPNHKHVRGMGELGSPLGWRRLARRRTSPLFFWVAVGAVSDFKALSDFLNYGLMLFSAGF